VRLIRKSRSLATKERLGGCGFPGCTVPAMCANCVQCLEHHDLQQLTGTCGFVDPLPVHFDAPDENLSVRAGVAMQVLEDDDVRLEGKPETIIGAATLEDLRDA